MSANSARLFPDLLGCSASFVEPPRSDGELPQVQIALPSGVSVTSDSSGLDDVLSAFFGRGITLARATPEDFTIARLWNVKQPVL